MSFKEHFKQLPAARGMFRLNLLNCWEDFSAQRQDYWSTHGVIDAADHRDTNTFQKKSRKLWTLPPPRRFVFSIVILKRLSVRSKNKGLSPRRFFMGKQCRSDSESLFSDCPHPKKAKYSMTSSWP
jgi:hypothetical protein